MDAHEYSMNTVLYVLLRVGRTPRSIHAARLGLLLGRESVPQGSWIVPGNMRLAPHSFGQGHGAADHCFLISSLDVDSVKPTTYRIGGVCKLIGASNKRLSFDSLFDGQVIE